MSDARAERMAFDDFADFYDPAMAVLDREAEIGFYSSLLNAGTNSLLELGCGTGTVTIPVALKAAELRGCNVRAVGLDQSEKMLAIARARAPEIEWLRGDMRRPCVGKGDFDLVVCCFNGVQLLLSDEDLLCAFRSVHAALSSDGVFAFDLYQPNLEFLTAPHEERRVRAFTDDRGCSLEVRERSDYDPSSRILWTDWRLFPQDSADATPLARLQVGLRQYFPDQIDQFMGAAGLVLRDRYSGFDRAPFTAAATRQVVVCGRA